MFDKFRCSGCGEWIVMADKPAGSSVVCRLCGAGNFVPDECEAATKSERDAYADRSGSCAPGTPHTTGDRGAGVADALGVLSWFVLILHVVAAVIIWVVLGMTGSGYRAEPNAVGIALGFGVLLEGVFLCVLFRAVYWISKNVIDVRSEVLRNRTA